MSDREKRKQQGSGTRAKREGSAQVPRRKFEALRRNTDETSLKWLFRRGPDGLWTWRKTSVADGVIAESTQSQKNYRDCIVDAKAHGYREWDAPSRLTPLSFSHVPGPVQQVAAAARTPGVLSAAQPGTPAPVASDATQETTP
jgi:hypothetical protein